MINPTLADAVLSLPDDDRAALAIRLLDSLEAPERAGPAGARRSTWAAEIERRAAAVRAGTEPVYDADQVFDDLADELRDQRRRAS